MNLLLLSNTTFEQYCVYLYKPTLFLIIYQDIVGKF